MSDFYRLDMDGQPVRCSLEEWGKSLESDQRQLAHTMIGDIRISTVFLGLDHRFDPKDGEKPILWETMVFGGPLDTEMDRYTSAIDAQIGHRDMIRRVVAEVCRENVPDAVQDIVSAIQKWERNF